MAAKQWKIIMKNTTYEFEGQLYNQKLWSISRRLHSCVQEFPSETKTSLMIYEFPFYHLI